MSHFTKNIQSTVGYDQNFINNINSAVEYVSGHISDRMAYIDITIGSIGDDVSSFQLCTRINGEGDDDTVHAVCVSPTVGRLVRLQRLENARDSDLMTLCEVQVYGYLFRGMVYHTCRVETAYFEAVLQLFARWMHKNHISLLFLLLWPLWILIRMGSRA